MLKPDLTCSHTFGTKGSGRGQFNYPRDVAIDRRGLVYVTDCWNHRIQIFTPEGQYLSQFGTKGSGIGQLDYPEGIIIDDNNLIYVTEQGDNHRISIFTIDGQFLRSFGRRGSSDIFEFNDLCQLTFDREGYLYVCDSSNNRLVVY